MRTFRLKFTNGQEIKRMIPDGQFVDEIFALMAAQRWAPLIFKQQWNKVADTSKWEIMVSSPDGKLLVREPFDAANTH